jgi:serine/threonine protein kinase
MGEYGSKWLTGFGPMGIVKSGDENYVIVCDSGLLENGECKIECRRWKAPEILKKEECQETEKSCVFTMGMMIYTMLMKRKPFHKENDEIAARKIMMGERPDLSSLEKKKCGFASIMRDC